MEKVKITQMAIAKKLGVTQGAVSEWFRCETKPTIENAILLKTHFGIPVEAWLDIASYVVNNSKRFGNLKILRKAHNGNA
ncbi:helix-turn-helix domain-containing protein [Campylobacter concisus]|uniref:helix-turn-helix transcriptional regulator n=1 Tax=Campylobacter concisus TaxID=199 RepID=UPI000D65E205